MRIGIVGDLHCPFEHPLYRRFCLDVFKLWRVDRVHFAGDIVDLHAISFWDHDPDGKSAGDESDAAGKAVAKWYRTFPDATVCVGNHDDRHFRVARKAGLPNRFVKTYADVWETPRWKWAFEHKADGVLYEHGTGTSGKDAALNLAIQKRMSCVIGHVHSYAGCKYHANPTSVIFGLNVGCGIDVRAYAFAYGRAFAIRPVLGCGIVCDGEFAAFVPMACGRGERYHRSRAGKRRSRAASSLALAA
jgi:predicted phosphodiesterase